MRKKCGKNRYMLLTILLVMSVSAGVQAQRVDDLFQKNVDFHIDIVPLGFTDPSIRFGSEIMFGNQWAAGLNLGVGVPIPWNSVLGFRQQRWEKGKYQVFEARPEIKFYWLRRERIGWYVAVEGLVSSMKGTTGKSYHFLDNNDSLQVNFDHAEFTKTKLGATAKMGGRVLFGKRVTLDFFSGIGLSNISSNFKNYRNRTESRSDPFFEGENYVAGKRVLAHLSGGLRVGILLWSKPPVQ